MKIFIGIFAISQFLAFTEELKILGVFSFCAHSHYTLGYKLIRELADRGHDTTLITCFPQNKPVKNLREISVAESAKPVGEYLKDLVHFGQFTYLGQLEYMIGLGLLYTEEVFKNENVQKLANSDEKFDLVITEHFVNDAMMIFHHIFKCPLILLAPGPLTLFNNHLVANPTFPSYVPNIVANYDAKMSFWQRFQNTYRHIAGELVVQFKEIPEQNKILKKYFPNAPELSTILYNASLLFISSTLSLSDPIPFQPNIKEIGGYHVSPPKPLPEDIKQFLDDAKEGVVLFSMGSNLKSSELDPEKRKAILNAFSKIKQKVLWKFEADLPEKPDNVMIMKWLPQLDVMAHPNVVAFISHGGLLGIIEAIYCGTPILGLPVYWDQIKNIEEAARKGFAVGLNFFDLNEELLLQALDEILNKPSYRRIAKERSNIMHDQPISQIDEAVFWVEYVVRHKGAPHLKSIAISLHWYQLYLVDIVIFVFIVITIVIMFVWLLLECLFRKSSNKLKKT